MLVRIVKDWEYPDLMRQTPNGIGIWENFKFTEDKIDDFDFLVVLNRPHEKIKCRVRKGGTWLLSQESPIPQYAWHKNTFAYFDNVLTFWDDVKSTNTQFFKTQTSLPWHINKNYDELKTLVPGNNKIDEVSWITSNAQSKTGHQLRMSFLNWLIDRAFSFKLFGRGFEPITDKFDGIFPYKYSIAIENYCCNDYWTEKLSDCFLSWTLPFYYGSKNIYNYFPKKSLILIDPANPEESLRIIREAIANNEWQIRLNAIAEARNLILEKYQFFPAITKLIRDSATSEIRQMKLIPACSKEGINDFSLGSRLLAKLENIFT